MSGKDWPGLISQSAKIPELRKEDWEKVYATCGGNIFLLRECVKEAGNCGDWNKGKLYLDKLFRWKGSIALVSRYYLYCFAAAVEPILAEAEKDIMAALNIETSGRPSNFLID